MWQNIWNSKITRCTYGILNSFLIVRMASYVPTTQLMHALDAFTGDIKGTMHCLWSHLSTTSWNMIFLDTKKSRDYKNLMTCTVIAHILVIPRSRPRNVMCALNYRKICTICGWGEDNASPEKWGWTCAPTPILVYGSCTPALTARSSRLVPSISQSVQELPFLSSHVHNDVNI